MLFGTGKSVFKSAQSALRLAKASSLNKIAVEGAEAPKLALQDLPDSGRELVGFLENNQFISESIEDIVGAVDDTRVTGQIPKFTNRVDDLLKNPNVDNFKALQSDVYEALRVNDFEDQFTNIISKTNDLSPESTKLVIGSKVDSVDSNSNKVYGTLEDNFRNKISTDLESKDIVENLVNDPAEV